MKTTHTLRLLGLAGLGSLIATSSFAQEAGYAYGGLSVGRAESRIDEERITARLLGQGLSTSSMQLDDKSTGYKLFSGYQFNRNIALEAGYFNLGKFGFTSNTLPAGTLNGQVKLQGLNLDLVGTLPLSERWSVLGRVGVQTARANGAFNGTGAVSVGNPRPSERGTNYKLGAGLQYEVNRSFLVRGEAERYRVNDSLGNRGDVNLYSVSLVFPFGRAPVAAPRLAAAPVYVAPVAQAAPPPEVVIAPAPAPAVVIAPVPAPVVTPPVRRRVSFEAESLFAFDKSAIRPEGGVALDNFVKELEGTRFETITVEGHTDRLGTAAYNEKLSLQRADAVKGYLVGSGKVDASKISAVGKGESAPQTKPEDCKGKAANAKLIACLQPDRRVEIEVVGTR